MIELEGKWCKNCKIFTDNLEGEALETIKKILETPSFENQRIRVMPDCHQGKGIVIGFTSTLGGQINPTHVGVDIGCSVSASVLDSCIKPEDYPIIEARIRRAIPIGKGNINENTEYEEKELFRFLTSEYLKIQSKHPDLINHVDRIDGPWISEFCKRVRIGERDFYKSLGSLGSGNHYIEYGEDSEGKGYITIHTGSRNLGTRICDYWVSTGSRSIVKEAIKEANKRIKAEEPDRHKWKSLIEQSTREIKKRNPDGYLSREPAKGYYSDMVVAQAYASFNHIEILRRILRILGNFGIKEIDRIKSTHNYIDFEDLVIRKGAIRAIKDEIVLIPFNMRDGIGIFRGLGNPDWNNSAPHGAGRRMSRAKAFETLDMSEFSKTMEGIYSTSVVPSVIDESPMAYKNSEEILNLINGKTVELIKIVKPKINIKDNGIRDRY